MDKIRQTVFRAWIGRAALAFFLLSLLTGPIFQTALAVSDDNGTAKGVARRFVPNDDPDPGFG